MDDALQWLTQQIARENPEATLWCLDENALDAFPEAQHWPHKPKAMCNRWDISQAAQAAGFTCEFSDFDLSAIPDCSLRTVFYRVSKEKPVVHHLLNEARRCLVTGGKLYLCGHKQEGIKTYIDKATHLFGSEKTSEKLKGNTWGAELTLQQTHETALDSSDYTQLRSIGELQGKTLWSKPGQFGWNKIDQGSKLLVDTLEHTLADRATSGKILDLGCGYGYLTLATQHLAAQQRILTDNNAAALAAAQHNCIQWGFNAQVLAGDCGNTLMTEHAHSVDLLLCNPPFHQGFSVDGDLTNRFLAAARQLLHPAGISVWVVNQFIPLERKAETHFARATLLAQEHGFNVIALSQPR